MTTFAMQRPNHFHRPAEGEYFTLLHLQRKLEQWGIEVEGDEQVTFRGWDFADRDLGEEPTIPPIGSKFRLYVSRLYDPVADTMTVVREKYNVFRVVDWLC